MMVRYLENMLLLLSYGYEDWLFIKVDEKLLESGRLAQDYPHDESMSDSKKREREDTCTKEEERRNIKKRQTSPEKQRK